MKYVHRHGNGLWPRQSLLENNFTLLRHSTTQQMIKHVQLGENILQPMATGVTQ